MVLLLISYLTLMLLVWRGLIMSSRFLSANFPLKLFKRERGRGNLIYIFKVFIKKHSSLRNSIRNKNKNCLAKFQKVTRNSLNKWLTVLLTSLTQLLIITSFLENSTQTDFVKQEVVNQIFQLTFHSPYTSVKGFDLIPLCTEMSLYFNILL